MAGQREVRTPASEVWRGPSSRCLGDPIRTRSILGRCASDSIREGISRACLELQSPSVRRYVEQGGRVFWGRGGNHAFHLVKIRTLLHCVLFISVYCGILKILVVLRMPEVLGVLGVRILGGLMIHCGSVRGNDGCVGVIRYAMRERGGEGGRETEGISCHLNTYRPKAPTRNPHLVVGSFPHKLCSSTMGRRVSTRGRCLYGNRESSSLETTKTDYRWSAPD